MKWRDWLSVLNESRQWAALLCISDAFFIFLAWLAYPETFRILVIIMTAFSIICIIFGMLLVWRRKLKTDKAFYDLLREPSKEHESRLTKYAGGFHKEKVNYLADKLRMLNDKLSDARMQSRDYEEYIESWAHEIKTPVSLITLVLENRKEEMSKLVYQRLEHSRINISDDVERILFYARLQASHVDYCLEKISLTLCCDDVLLELKELVEEKEVKVISHIEDVPVVSDKKSLEFIIMQILVNSVKYSNEKVQSLIWLKTGLDSEKNRYYLNISDNGIGMLSSDLPFISDKGFTGDNPNRSKSTGMGLYLVKKLCDELKIDIEVESEYGKSFEIKLLFPIVDEA